MFHKFLVYLASRLLSIFSGIYSFFIKIDDFKNIPIIINNRNRYSFLKQLVDALESRGYKNIIIIDNKSSYPPLLDYYKSINYKVLLLEQNLGFKSLEQLELYKEIRKSYFVYTDSDVVPIDECPDDFMEKFLKLLKANFWISKVGFSLKLDDLPNHYDKKNQVIDWESQFFEKKVSGGYLAPIDTTFALHKPYSLISTRGIFKMIRTSYPYEARHMPWYNNSECLSEEELYYIDSVEIGTHWSKGLKCEEKNFIQRFFINLKGEK